MNPHIAIVRVVMAINEDLCQAIAYYEMFAPSGLNAPLIERVNHHQIQEGFNVVAHGARPIFEPRKSLADIRFRDYIFHW
jgi:hypothetical protein